MAPTFINRLLNWGSGGVAPSRATYPLSWEQYQALFSFGGSQYVVPQTTLGQKVETPSPSFEGYVQGIYKSNGVVFACMAARMQLFSEARFQFRQLRSGRPGDLFGSPALEVLERPWPNGTTSDLLKRAIQDNDLSGNFYAYRRGQRLYRMRPDWVSIVLGSNRDPDDPELAIDAEVVGYVYHPQGAATGKGVQVLMPDEVCHFAHNPDPAARFRGMSWLTPVLKDLMSDDAATQHKLKFFEQGATVNLHVNFDSPLIKTQEQFDEHVAAFKRGHEGTANAFKTLMTAHGTTVTPIGSNLQDAEFKSVQGAGETRIAAAARVPPIIVGLSEGLGAATYSNYGQARRAFADLTMRPLWRDMAASLSAVVDVPASSELWYDDRDIPFLQEDVQDDANARQTDANAMRALIDAGFEPQSVVDAITAGDLSRLEHTGLFSVQLQPPMPDGPPEVAASPNGNGTPIGAVDG